jgi:hypothetical protein
MSTRQLAAVQSMASIKSVPVAPIARAQGSRSVSAVDRLAIGTPANFAEVSWPHHAHLWLRNHCNTAYLRFYIAMYGMQRRNGHVGVLSLQLLSLEQVEQLPAIPAMHGPWHRRIAHGHVQQSFQALLPVHSPF